MTANERFELIGDLYYRRHHRLRPGKDDRLRDSSSEENHALFDNWIATGAFNDALQRIHDLETQNEKLRKEIDVD